MTFVLVKFYGWVPAESPTDHQGTPREGKQRQLLDAYVIEAGGGNSFPIYMPEGVEDIEVFTEAIS